MSDMNSWGNMIALEMSENGETSADIEASTLDDAGLAKTFDTGYGGPKGEPFTVWTKGRVYFPVVYDGAEWVSSVSRNPDGNPTDHIGRW